jgi:hypothetical protein
MQSAPVRQLGVLAELFGEVLRSCRPESVAVLGVAGGNGLERIDPAVTHRICGVDINPEYLRTARGRFAGLETFCADLADGDAPLPTVRLVHAALIFEHAGAERCLENALRMVGEGGALSVVLQLPSSTESAVGGGSPLSIRTLAPRVRLIDPGELTRKIEGRGFRFVRSVRRALPSGKAFWMGIFERAHEEA